MMILLCTILALFFFFNDTATTEIYTLSLHDALPIFTALTLYAFSSDNWSRPAAEVSTLMRLFARHLRTETAELDRKSTRLNSSHDQISYAVFCLKKQKILLESVQLLN